MVIFQVLPYYVLYRGVWEDSKLPTRRPNGRKLWTLAYSSVMNYRTRMARSFWRSYHARRFLARMCYALINAQSPRIGTHGSGALGSLTTTGNYGPKPPVHMEVAPSAASHPRATRMKRYWKSKWTPKEMAKQNPREVEKRLTESPWKCSADQGTKWNEK